MVASTNDGVVIVGLLDRGQSALLDRMKIAAGRTITYTRKSDGLTATLTAWPGNTLYARTTEQPGASRIWGDRDYLFAVADLAIANTAFTPAKGDRITETIDGVATTFELQTPTAEPVWRYADQLRTMIRVHTKRVT